MMRWIWALLASLLMVGDARAADAVVVLDATQRERIALATAPLVAGRDSGEVAATGRVLDPMSRLRARRLKVSPSARVAKWLGCDASAGGKKMRRRAIWKSLRTTIGEPISMSRRRMHASSPPGVIPSPSDRISARCCRS